MVEDPKEFLGSSCIQAYKRILHECLAFRSAELYLLRVEVQARKGFTPIKDAHDQFAAKLLPHYESPSRYFVERSFISLVASFELFLQDVLSAVLLIHPKKIGQVDFKLIEVIDASDTDELVRKAIDATINKLMYKKPMEYLTEVASLLSIDQTPLLPQWPVFVEAKARRDLGVHSGWRCNSIYLKKVQEAGLISSLNNGQFAHPIGKEYLDSVCDAFSSLSGALITAVLAKHVH